MGRGNHPVINIYIVVTYVRKQVVTYCQRKVDSRTLKTSLHADFLLLLLTFPLPFPPSGGGAKLETAGGKGGGGSAKTTERKRTSSPKKYGRKNSGTPFELAFLAWVIW